MEKSNVGKAKRKPSTRKFLESFLFSRNHAQGNDGERALQRRAAHSVGLCCEEEIGKNKNPSTFLHSAFVFLENEILK